MIDRETGKEAALNDPQAVRNLLTDVCTRLGRHGAPHDTKDSTEVVAKEILGKAGGTIDAVKLIRDAESLAEIFEGTSLAKATQEISTKGDRPAKQIPLARGEDLELTQGDAGKVIEELWQTFCGRIEASEGEQSQTISVTVTWFPPTANRDGYIGTHANMNLKGKKITRTGQVTKKGRGKTATHQFNLFADQADSE